MSVSLLSKSLSFQSIASIDEIFTEHMTSSQFLSQIMPCAISTVLHRRCLFTPEYIRIKTLKDAEYISFRSVMPKQHCAYRLFSYFNLIDKYIKKKYMKELFISIENSKTDELQEEFQFVFKYNLQETSQHYFGDLAVDQADKFFRKINLISSANRYSEDEIQIKFGFSFNESVPRSVLTSKDIRLQAVANRLPTTKIASLKGSNFEVELLISKSGQTNGNVAGSAQLEEICTNVVDVVNTQESNSSTLQPEISPGVFQHTNTRNSKELSSINVEEFDLLNAQFVSARHLQTPVPRSKVVRKLIKMEKLGAKRPRVEISSPSSFNTSGSDFMKNDEHF